MMYISYICKPIQTVWYFPFATVTSKIEVLGWKDEPFRGWQGNRRRLSPPARFFFSLAIGISSPIPLSTHFPPYFWLRGGFGFGEGMGGLGQRHCRAADADGKCCAAR